MKKYIYTILLACIGFCLAGNVSAQTACNANWSFSITTQPSEGCYATGKIIVTLNADPAEIDVNQAQYGAFIEGGIVIQPQPSNVIDGLPPGTYTVTVRAFCKVNNEYTPVKEQRNVVVGGSYTTMEASFNTGACRNSYAACPTGILAMDVTKGSGSYTFTIIEAPSGVSLGNVVPTRSGNTYTLPGNYPPGTYNVSVSDGCYTSERRHTLSSLDFPSPSISDLMFNPSGSDASNNCSSVIWNAGSVASSSDYYNYWSTGMYEIGIAPVGSTPATWTVWRSNTSPTVDISPYSLRDLIGASGKLEAHIRLKECPSINKKFAVPAMRVPTLSRSVSYGCDDYTFKVYPTYANYDDLLCYPLTVRLTETATGTVTEKTITSFSSRTTPAFTLKYGTAYSYRIIDADGYETTGRNETGTISPTTYKPSLSITLSSITDNFCATGTYRYSYYVNTSSFACYPVYVTITDTDGNVVVKTIYSSATGTTLSPMISTDPAISTVHTSTTSVYAELEYDKTYTFKAVYIYDGVRTEEVIRTVSPRASSVISGYPTSYTLSLPSQTPGCDSRGRLQVTRNGSDYYIPPGTRITITGPAGYTSQTTTTSSSSTSTTSVPFNETFLPAGEYYATIYTKVCGIDIAPITTPPLQVNIATNVPQSYALTVYATTSATYYCGEDLGQLRVTPSSGTVPPNTTYTVTGPNGNTIASGTLTTGSSSTNVTSVKELLPGQYTVTVINGCGSAADRMPKTATLTLADGRLFNGRQLDRTTNQLPCGGLEVTPTGLIAYNGSTRTTYYRLISATDVNGQSIAISPYNTTTRSRNTSGTFSGNPFLLTESGTYILGITYNSTSCAMRTVAINYDESNRLFELDPHKTSGYVCVGAEIGIMSMSTINGMGPFTYELWNETNNTKIMNYNPAEYPDIDINRAVFEYGSANDKFYIRGKDVGCGNSFAQQLSLIDLRTARIVYAPKDKICEGDVIRINCVTLGETEYEWTGPNGFTSTNQNLVIPNATTNMTGTYTVSVCPEFCGEDVVESIYIEVKECFIPVNPNVHVMK